MFGKPHGRTSDGSDAELSALLRQWPAIGPKAAFEADVWRRIRSGTGHVPEGSLRGLLDWFLPHPVWAGVATVCIALVAGMLAGVVAPGRTHANHALLQPGTIAGTYLALSEGGRP